MGTWRQDTFPLALREKTSGLVHRLQPQSCATSLRLIIPPQWNLPLRGFRQGPSQPLLGGRQQGAEDSRALRNGFAVNHGSNT